MTRRLPYCFTLACLLGLLLAAGPRSLWSYATEDVQWLVRTMPAKGDDQPQWGVVERSNPSPKFVERARLGREPAQLAVFGSRLAILFADGGWTVLAAGQPTAGPDLPDGLRPIAIASAADGLLFLATRPTPTTAPASTSPASPRLLLYDGQSFHATSDAPAPPDALRQTLVLAEAGRTIVGYRDAGSISLHECRTDTWRSLGSIDCEAAWLLGDDRRGTVLVTRSGSAWQTRAIRQNGEIGEPTSLITVDWPPARPVAASMVAGELRLSWDEAEEVVEATFAADGRAVGEAVRSKPAADTRAVPSTFDRIVSTLGLAAVILVLLTAGRRAANAGAESSDAPTIQPPKPAPLARRLAAGLIDAVPLYIAFSIISSRVDRADGQFLRLDQPGEQWTLAAGVSAYILLNFLCEQLWQASPGKAMFGLRVVTVTGEVPTTGALLIRNGLRVIDLNLVMLLIVPLSALRQRLGDILANTMVVDSAGFDAKSGREDADKRN